MPEIIQQI
nr:unnamed protein product [Callosobruchus chinensis]